MVELAAVTLGDDCGEIDSVLPPVAQLDKPGPRITRPPGAAAPMRPEDICEDCAAARAHCDQTSMQLALRGNPGTGSTAVKIKKVELLDSRGAFLAELTARQPSRWNGESYVAWDQSVAADEKLAASYMLSMPDWDKLTNGRWSAHTKSFQLRVTLAVGSSDRTVDKQSITPAMLEPPVPT